MIFKLIMTQPVARWLFGLSFVFALLFCAQHEVHAVTNFTVIMDNNKQFNVSTSPLGGVGGCNIITGDHSYISQNMRADATGNLYHNSNRAHRRHAGPVLCRLSTDV